MKRESIWNSVGSLALILPLLFLAFRSVWLFSAGAIPSMASLLVVLGLLGLTGVKLVRRRHRVGGDAARARRRRRRPALRRASAGAGRGQDGHRRGRGHRESVGQHALRHADDGRDVLRAGIRGLPEPAAARAAHRPQHGGVRHPDAGADPGAPAHARAPHPRPGERHAARLAALRGVGLEHRRTLVWTSIAITIVLGFAATRLRVNASLDRLRSTTPAAAYEEEVRRAFGLPSDVFVVLQQRSDLQPLLDRNERLVSRARDVGAVARFRRRLVAPAVRGGAAARARGDRAPSPPTPLRRWRAFTRESTQDAGSDLAVCSRLSIACRVC